MPLKYPLIPPYIPLKGTQGSQEPWVSNWKPFITKIKPNSPIIAPRVILNIGLNRPK